jgi:hypothetical protein
MAMNDFSTILTSLEEASRTAERAGGATLASLLGVFARGDASVRTASEDPVSFVSRVYGAESEPKAAPPEPMAQRSDEQSQRLPGREEFFTALLRAEGSLDELRALRRRIAWLCHPDRREKDGARQAERLLAEFNAQIDAAMARAPAIAARRAIADAPFRRRAGARAGR